MEVFRQTASTLWISWQWHVRNVLFHFCQLSAFKSISTARDIQCGTGVEFRFDLVPFIPLYGAETWALKKEDGNRLLVFEMICLRKILGLSLLNKIHYNRNREFPNLNNTVIIWVNHKKMRLFLMHTSRYHPQDTYGDNYNWKKAQRKTCQEVGRVFQR